MMINQTTIQRDRRSNEILKPATDDQITQVFDAVADPIGTRTYGEHNGFAPQAGVRLQMQQRYRVVRLQMKRIRSE